MQKTSLNDADRLLYAFCTLAGAEFYPKSGRRPFMYCEALGEYVLHFERRALPNPIGQRYQDAFFKQLASYGYSIAASLRTEVESDPYAAPDVVPMVQLALIDFTTEHSTQSRTHYILRTPEIPDVMACKALCDNNPEGFHDFKRHVRTKLLNFARLAGPPKP